MKGDKAIRIVSLIAVLAFFSAGLFQMGRFIISDTKAEFARYYGVGTEEERIKRIPGLEPIVEILERFPELGQPGARALLINPDGRFLSVDAHPYILNYYLSPGKLFSYQPLKPTGPGLTRVLSLDRVPREWLEKGRINWILYNYGHPDVTVKPYP